MAQLMPLPFTVSCFSKIQIGFTFLVPAHPGSPGKRAVKRVCVCVCVYHRNASNVEYCSRLSENSVLIASKTVSHTNVSDHIRWLTDYQATSSTQPLENCRQLVQECHWQHLAARPVDTQQHKVLVTDWGKTTEALKCCDSDVEVPLLELDD